MKEWRMLQRLFLLILALQILPGYLVAAAVDDENASMYQISTYELLENGSYDGIISAEDLNAQGDLGLGTFDRLDGELIQVNGTVYQAKSDGTVIPVARNQTIAFANTVTFKPRYNLSLFHTDKNATDFAIMSGFPSPDQVYAIRIAGSFLGMTVRSVPPQEKPYPSLQEAIRNQSTFSYPEINGTLEGFWFPSYMEGVNTVGYHLHFISDDRTKGGHALNYSVQDATVEIEPITSFAVDITR